MFFKQVENTLGKREIAHYEQFFLFPQCFQKSCTNQGLFGKGLITESRNIGGRIYLENTVGNGKMQVTSIVAFPNVFSSFFKQRYQYRIQIYHLEII